MPLTIGQFHVQSKQLQADQAVVLNDDDTLGTGQISGMSKDKVKAARNKLSLAIKDEFGKVKLGDRLRLRFGRKPLTTRRIQHTLAKYRGNAVAGNMASLNRMTDLQLRTKMNNLDNNHGIDGGNMGEFRGELTQAVRNHPDFGLRKLDNNALNHLISSTIDQFKEQQDRDVAAFKARYQHVEAAVTNGGQELSAAGVKRLIDANQVLLPEDKWALKDVVFHMEAAAAALDGDVPLDTAGIHKRSDDLTDMQDAIRNCVTGHPLDALPRNAPQVAQDLVADARAMIAELNDEIAYMQRLEGSNPVSTANVKAAKDLWVEAGKLLVDAEPVSSSVNKQQVKREIGRRFTDPPTANDQTTDFQGDVEAHMKEFTKSLQSLLAEELGRPVKDIEKELLAKHLDARDQQAWDTLQMEVRFTDANGRRHQYESQMTPANSITNAGFQTNYNAHKGVNCHRLAEPNHAVNMWHTELTGSDGGRLFHGVRHGVHCAKKIKNDDDRATANHSRAEETARAAFVNHPKLAQLREQYQGNGVPVVLNLSSINLQTPSALSEKSMVMEQFAAWESLETTTATTPLQLRVGDGHGGHVTVAVKVKVDAFDFGVNRGAVGTTSGIAGGGWRRVSNRNKKALKGLLGENLKPNGAIGGRVGNYLAGLESRNDLSANEKAQQRQTVTTLANQIRKIWSTGAHKSENHDAYKMPARLALLTSMIEDVPCFNCKSGKDRTGMLDAEVKFLASQIATTGRVPEPGSVHDDQEVQMFRQFVFNTGNHEIQQLNTGFMGYKTNGVASINERMGDDDVSKARRLGGAKAVKT